MQRLLLTTRSEHDPALTPKGFTIRRPFATGCSCESLVSIHRRDRERPEQTKRYRAEDAPYAGVH